MTLNKVKLADCCIIKPPKSEAKKLIASDDLVSFVPMKNLGIDTSDLLLDADKKLSDVSGSYTYFKDNDVLLAKITPCFENGKLGVAKGLTNGIGFGSSEFIVFRSKGNIVPEYLYYYLLQQRFRDVGKSVMTGAVGHKRVPKDYIENSEILLPSLETQKKIVAKLDQAFADIEKAKVNAEQNLKNAHELLLSQRHEMFHAMSLESDLVPLTSVCNEIFAGGDAPKGNFSKDLSEKYKIPIYANAVKNNGLYGFTDIARALKPAITVAARGSGTGHVEMRMKPFFPIVRLIVLIPDSAVIILEYLKYAILGLDILSSGSAIPQLTVPMIKGYSVPLPSLKVQRLMIEKFNKLSEQIACLESIYKEKINCLDELKQSILQKAFNGEIT
jgi:type I restriction enzyme S subunit